MTKKNLKDISIGIRAEKALKKAVEYCKCILKKTCAFWS
jgi:hypothetical protein